MERNRLQELRSAWSSRQNELGNNKRAVLFKKLPDFLNNSIHEKHVKFIIEGLPSNINSVLDVGCGYGRLSREIGKYHPEIKFMGMDICTAFAEAYKSEFGRCYNGSLDDFESDEKYDLVLMTTILMYQDPRKLKDTLEKYWSMVRRGGRMICIEPASSWIVQMRRKKILALPQPTGNEVNYFSKSEFYQLIGSLQSSQILTRESFGIFPLINMPIIHYGAVVLKGDG